jgi:hypothetical protein
MLSYKKAFAHRYNAMSAIWTERKSLRASGKISECPLLANAAVLTPKQLKGVVHKIGDSGIFGTQELDSRTDD